MGSTYAYLYFNHDDTSTLVGDLGEAGIDLSVERLAPETDMYLVPLLDAALGNAIKGTGGVDSCIDSNNNLSCEIYQIRVHNPSTTNVMLTGDVTLVASGEGSIYNNLKWELLDSPTERKTEYESYGMGTNILEDRLYLEVGDTRIYYIAVWISETGTDQLETDKGKFGGIVEFRTSSGQGVTASFGEFDDNYCNNNDITKLGDCILISEKYSDTVEEAKTYISSKEADFTKTAPIITYSEKIEEDVTGTNVFGTTKKLQIATSYTFDSDTGRYTLINASSKTMLEAVSDEDTTYYVCNKYYITYCNTMYIIYEATSSTSDGVTTYRATKVDRYTQNMETQNISGKGLYMAQDDYGDSYYFRGKVENNYVSFAGFIWRIVRINGDGSIRLIYSGTSTSDTGSATSIETSQYNSKYYDPTYVGYTYNENFVLNETNTTDTNYSIISVSDVYYYGTSYAFDEITKKFSISGDKISGTWENTYNEVIANYPYTCLSTSEDGTCNFLLKMIKYVNNSTATINYISYSSTDYESTLKSTTNSVIKTKIDTWYENNLLSSTDGDGNLYSKYLSDVVFCNDRSISSGSGYLLTPKTLYGPFYRLASNRTPSLSCVQDSDEFSVANEKLKYPIGLLSIDEAALAGGISDNVNTQYYLYTGQTYWTMSPSSFRADYAYALVWYVYSDGSLNATLTSGTIGVRPVINLKANIEITSGNGTKNAPYIVSY